MTERLRFSVEPRDVPPCKAARRLHLTEAEFRSMRQNLEARGFPKPDPTTGMYDLKAIDTWMDARSGLTRANNAVDASTVARGRIEALGGG